MSNQPNHSELIDAYLSGQLSPEESDQLMQLLDKDPSLKEEFNLQQDMVNTIREHRKMQLKSRLDNIEVGTGGGYSLPSAGALKLVAGAAILALLGGGGWFAYQQTQTPEETSQLEINQPVNLQDENPGAEAKHLTETIPAPAEVQQQEEQAGTDAPARPQEEYAMATESEGEARPAETAAPAVNKAERLPAVDSKAAEVTPKEEFAASQPEIVKPEVITFFDEPDALDSVPEANAPKDKLNETHSFSTQNIEVTTKSDKQYPFHYMFHDNQLHIYGDFSQVPYEVLEVNTGTLTHYYLYHGGNYYELNPDQRRITRLKELKNEKIMQELEITRTQKINR